jgi:hypothetical protein
MIAGQAPFKGNSLIKRVNGKAFTVESDEGNIRFGDQRSRVWKMRSGVVLLNGGKC